MSENEASGSMMHAPGVEHERLKPFLGTFRAQVKLWMGSGDPMVSTGTMKNTSALGGLFMRQEYVGDPNEGPFPSFEGHGFWGYNLTSKRYEGFWIDNVTSIMQNETGEVDASGKVWTMYSQMPDPQTGVPIAKRSRITLLDDDHHKLEMFFSKESQEFRGMEIEYTRSD